MTETDLLPRSVSWFKAMLLLSTVEEDLAAIIFRTHGEVDPIGRATLFKDELVAILTMGARALLACYRRDARTVSIVRFFVVDVEEDGSVADHLLGTVAADVHGATRQMVRVLRPATFHIHLLTPIPAVDDHAPITGARPR